MELLRLVRSHDKGVRGLLMVGVYNTRALVSSG
jgi:hypothetical protein